MSTRWRHAELERSELQRCAAKLRASGSPSDLGWREKKRVDGERMDGGERSTEDKMEVLRLLVAEYVNNRLFGQLEEGCAHGHTRVHRPSD